LKDKDETDNDQQILEDLEDAGGEDEPPLEGNILDQNLLNPPPPLDFDLVTAVNGLSVACDQQQEQHYYYIPDDNILHQDHSTNPVDNQYRNQLYQNNQSEDVVLELVPVRDSSTSPAPKMLI